MTRVFRPGRARGALIVTMAASAALVGDAVTAKRPGGAVARPRIAITIDDLPWNGPIPRAGLSAYTGRLLAELRRHRAPATGFVVCRRGRSAEGILRSWLDAGMGLGNHSEAHADLNDTPLNAWLDDVRSCNAFLQDLTGSPPRYFRYPYLHRGATREKRDSARTGLAALGYRVAPVSVDNSEWILARPYDAALAAGDSARARRIGDLLVSHLMEALDHAREVARRKVGRDVDHVLLLHANALVADHMGALLDTLQAEGFRFVSLGEALRDPIYQRADGYAGPKGLSWLYRAVPATPGDVEWDDAAASRLRAALAEL